MRGGFHCQTSRLTESLAPSVGGGPASTDSASWDPSAYKAVARGYCFRCDRSVDVEYYPAWCGLEPPKKCLRCGSSDVEFLGRVAERLLERIEELERQLAKANEVVSGALDWEPPNMWR